MIEAKLCPWCGAKATTHSFISRIAELPEPKKLFGRWSIIKMRYKDIPLTFSTECSAYCEGFCEYADLYTGSTPDEAVEDWNRRAGAVDA